MTSEERRHAVPCSVNIDRRHFLRSLGAGAALGLPGVGSTQETTTIELRGQIGGWEGVSPANIEEVENPTLSLSPGTDYTIVWKNVDGTPHNVVIADADETQLVRSNIVSERGATQRVEFTATEEMATYSCEIHPSTMRGAVTTGGEAVTDSEATTESPEQSFLPEGPTVRLEQVASGLVSPIGAEPLPGDNGMLVADQIGLVQHFDDGLEGEPVLDIRDSMVTVGEGTWSEYDERGLLGLAVHPEFTDNGLFYVRYSAPPREGEFEEYGHTAILSEFEATADATRARSDSERVLLEVAMPGPVHNGGALAFGPDGYLYGGYADGSSTNDAGQGHVEDWYDGNPGGNGQDVTENLLGSIIRIDVDSWDGDMPYGIPDDNPLVGRAGLDEHYAWGLRNPWRLSFDSDGRLFVGDPGGRQYEGVYLVEKGGNYGWNVLEASHCFDAQNMSASPETCPDSVPESVRSGEPLREPIIEYPHWDRNGVTVGLAVIGGYRYEDDGIPDLSGRYVFGDFSRSYERPDGSLFAASPPTNGSDEWSMEKLVVENSANGRLNQYLLAFGRGSSGALYALTNETGAPSGESGRIYRLAPPEQSVETSSPTDANTTPVDGGLPFSEVTVGSVAVLGGLGGIAGYLLSRRDDDSEAASSE